MALRCRLFEIKTDIRRNALLWSKPGYGRSPVSLGIPWNPVEVIAPYVVYRFVDVNKMIAGWVLGDCPGLPDGKSLSFAWPKESNQRKGHPASPPCGVPCASRQSGRLRNSLRSNSARRKPPLWLRCSAAQKGCWWGGVGRNKRSALHHVAASGAMPVGYCALRSLTWT